MTSMGSIEINLSYVRGYGAMAEDQRAAPLVIALDAGNNSSRASMSTAKRLPLK
jgi:hypothetical protein